jgi:hypothetical protein
MSCGSSIIRYARSYAAILVSRRGIVTLALSALGVLVYYLVSWSAVGAILATVTATVLRAAGHSTSTDGTMLVLDGMSFRIADGCTFVSLILAGLPFVWRGDRFRFDALRLLFFIAAVQTANLARLCWTTLLASEGVVWQYSHDLVIYLTYGPIAALTFCSWMVAMKRRLAQKTDGQPESGESTRRTT